MKNWKTHSKKTALDCGKFLKVEYHDVEFDEGKRISTWPWVITPDFVNVVVERSDGDFLVFHQSKYAIDSDSLGIVGGYIEPCEIPIEAAKRELMEETGYEAPDWVSLGSYPVDANRGCGTGHFFLARHAQAVREPDADDLEKYEITTLTKTELLEAVRSCRFKVMTWAAAVALSLPHLD